MLFNSLEFAIFLPLVFLLYWFVFDYAIKSNSNQLFWQNLFIVIVSYIFYGWWNCHFLLLIAFTSFCSWESGLLIKKSAKPKLWLTLNIVLNLLILCLFKYFNFFVDSFCNLFHLTNTIVISVILPVGISFYTFQALSYSIDVYRNKIQPTKDIIAFFAYVSFFPQLVAGPIERATNLLPQFEKKRIFDYSEAVDGMRRILWGLFKKIVIADNCAIYVDQVWNNYINERGSTLLLAAILFAFQIYGDFSGYSDIAIGTAKLFGIKLKDNFLTPYFSRNVAEFWKRWHISLNSWFVDYVYIPLGGSRAGKWNTIRNTFVIFLLSGLWHGANWTYVVWGIYHALFFIPLILLNRTKSYQGTATWKHIPQILLTFVIVTIGWIIFRAPSIEDAYRYIYLTCQMSIFSIPILLTKMYYIPILIAITMLFFIEWLQRNKNHALSLSHYNWSVRWCAYVSISIFIIVFGAFNESFIYFQF